MKSTKTCHRIAVILLGTLAMTSANAMGKKAPTPEPEVPAPPVVVMPPPVVMPPAPPVVVPPPTQSGSIRYREGYDMGERNGILISQRIYDRTIAVGGCADLDAYQDALLRVNRAVKPPALGAGSETELVRGFFKGYLDSLRKAIESSRNGCGRKAFSSGSYAGAFYGSLLCQMTAQTEDVVSQLEVVHLYDDWTGGVVDSSRECVTQAVNEMSACGFTAATLPSAYLSGLESGCHD